MEHPAHSRSEILASLLELLERLGGSADRDQVAASIRRRMLGDAERLDEDLDALITRLIRRALVAEWVRVEADTRTLTISAEGHHVLNLHRQGGGTLSRLIRRPRSQVMGNRGPS